MAIRKTAICATLALSLGACAQGGTDGFGGVSGDTIGLLGGGAGGALLGSQVGSGSGRLAATAAGTLIGALAGRAVARQLDTTDEQRAIAAERNALARNDEITWNNPQTGNSGKIQPVRTYELQNGQLCREYAHTVYIEGQAETARGTACRQSDGTWQIVS